MTKHPLIEKAEGLYLKKTLPPFNVGDTVKVLQKVTEGARSRMQAFEGTVILKKGSGMQASFTVRRISFGEGVEKTFPLHSPSVESVAVTRPGRVRKSKLYYLRGRIGKKWRVREAIRGQKTEETRESEALTEPETH